MNKTEIMAALDAAGVQYDPTMTVPQLKELAAAHNVSLVKAKSVAGGVPAGEEPAADAPQGDDELIAAKVAAGLSYEQAVEVIATQRAADAASAAK